MKIKWQIVIAALVFIIGVGSLLAYDLYLQPYVFSTGVVKVKVVGDFIPKNYKLSNNDLYIAKVRAQDVPKEALLNLKQAENKITNVNLTNGTILTNALVDVDNLQPGEGEGIFPIPKAAIYAVNGTLRSRDKVDVYLVDDSDKKVNPLGNTTNAGYTNYGKFLEKVPVSYVRTEDNNDVKDSDKGNTTNRLTSTGKVSSPEIKLSDEQGIKLSEKLTQGYKLWIVRVE